MPHIISAKSAQDLPGNLKIEFFERSAEKVAKDLLGKKIVRVLPDGEKLSGIITETEAYVGVKDKASHSYGGRRTKRNEVMYGKAGVAYVYFTYGMHWLLNFITSYPGDPQGVLIRELDVAPGPAILTKYLRIDKSFYGEPIFKSKILWVEETDIKVATSDIEKLPRIGIDYAEEWKNKLLRFKLKTNKKTF